MQDPDTLIPRHMPGSHLWIGFDPGVTGGFVILDDHGDILHAQVMPVLGKDTKRKRVDTAGFKAAILKAQTMRHTKLCTFAIERVSSMPTDGGVQAFRFGKFTGALFAVADWTGSRVVEVSPKDWQKAFLRGYNTRGREAIKASAALAAQDRWPELREILGTKKNWGVADAAFVADAARIMEQQRAKRLAGE